MAVSRAVNRALRKAYAIGICSAEELASPSPTPTTAVRLRIPRVRSGPAVRTLSVTPTASVQDRLKLMLRDHQLDPPQVLSYACRFLGVREIKSVSGAELRRFADHLEQLAIASPAWLRAELHRDQRADIGLEQAASASEDAA